MKELIIVKQLPVIEENLKKMSVEIDEKVNNAMALICTKENKQEVKNLRTELNSQFKELEEQRKTVKKKVLDPYEKFEEIYKTYISNKFKSADQDLKSKIDAIEDQQKIELEEEVKLYFEELKISKHIDFIHFENTGLKIGVSDNPTKLRKQIDAFVNKVDDDLKLIDTQEHKDEILVEYMKSLNVSKAITDVKDRHFILEQVAKKQEEKKEIVKQESETIEKVNQVVQAPIEEEKIYHMNFSVWGTKQQLQDLKSYIENGGFDRYE